MPPVPTFSRLKAAQEALELRSQANGEQARVYAEDCIFSRPDANRRGGKCSLNKQYVFSAKVTVQAPKDSWS